MEPIFGRAIRTDSEEFRELEERRIAAEEQGRSGGQPSKCQSVFGCNRPAFGQAENGVWLCLPCLAVDDW